MIPIPSVKTTASPDQTGVSQLPPSTETLPRTYQWNDAGGEWTWQLNISQALYDYYKALPRSPTPNYSVYVTHPFHQSYIDGLVEKIKIAADEQGFTPFETVSFAAAFVQNLEYTSDSVTTKYDEYPRYPVETLVDGGGDCEDTSILLAALVRGLGYGVVLIIYPGTPESPGHCAVGVKGGDTLYGTYYEYSGSKYYYVETTGTGWVIGEMPPEYRGRSAKIYTMVPVPILDHAWQSRANGNLVDIEVTVTNLGSAPAQGVYLLTGFDAGDDLVWNRQFSPTFDVGVDQTMKVTMSVKVPLGKHTRILVQVIYGGYEVSESFSKWFDT